MKIKKILYTEDDIYLPCFRKSGDRFVMIVKGADRPMVHYVSRYAEDELDTVQTRLYDDVSDYFAPEWEESTKQEFKEIMLSVLTKIQRFKKQLNVVAEKISNKLHCCSIGCDNAADFNLQEVGEGKTYEDYIHVCRDHLPEMISENELYQVRRLNADDEPNR